MTDTPRTDAAIRMAEDAGSWEDTAVQIARISQSLERDLATAQARIAKLETINKEVAHCGKCGDTWYDSGIASAECPYCRIAKLESALDFERHTRIQTEAHFAELERALDKYGDGVDWIQRAMQAEAELDALRAGLRAVEHLIDNSRGVAGLHLNGDIAPWEELRDDGRFCEWLADVYIAIDAAREGK